MIYATALNCVIILWKIGHFAAHSLFMCVGDVWRAEPTAEVDIYIPEMQRLGCKSSCPEATGIQAAIILMPVFRGGRSRSAAVHLVFTMIRITI